MEPIIISGILGAVGGLTRGTVGLLKALSLKKRIIWPYWTITITIAVIIGVFTGMIFNFDPKLSLLAGYAGTDILEGLYKTLKTQKISIQAKYGKGKISKRNKETFKY